MIRDGNPTGGLIMNKVRKSGIHWVGGRHILAPRTRCLRNLPLAAIPLEEQPDRWLWFPRSKHAPGAISQADGVAPRAIEKLGPRGSALEDATPWKWHASRVVHAAHGIQDAPMVPSRKGMGRLDIMLVVGQKRFSGEERRIWEEQGIAIPLCDFRYIVAYVVDFAELCRTETDTRLNDMKGKKIRKSILLYCVMV